MIALSVLLQASVGVWQSWGALNDGARCWAVSAPAGPRRGDAFLSISQWPGLGVRDQLQVRLSRERAPDADVVLAIGGRRFPLVARGRDAWSPDAAGDRAVLTAIRSSRALAVESRDAGGRRFVDGYALGGAPTAIDAARLACRRG